MIQDDRVVEFLSEEAPTNVYSRCEFKSDLVKAKKPPFNGREQVAGLTTIYNIYET